MKHSLHSAIALALASLIVVQSVYSQPYKIVDKDGNVTFSQYPPVENSEDVTVEHVDVTSASSGKTALSTKPNGQQQCGDLTLPLASATRRNGGDYFLSQVVNKQADWEYELARLEQNIEKINTSQFNRNKGSIGQLGSYQTQQAGDAERRKQETIQEARDLRCAIEWAKSQSDGAGNYYADQSEEYQRLQEVYSRLLSQQVAECGEEPYLDPSNIAQTSRRNNWDKCADRHASKIRSVEREIQKVSRSLNSFN